MARQRQSHQHFPIFADDLAGRRTCIVLDLDGRRPVVRPPLLIQTPDFTTSPLFFTSPTYCSTGTVPYGTRMLSLFTGTSRIWPNNRLTKSEMTLFWSLFVICSLLTDCTHNLLYKTLRPAACENKKKMDMFRYVLYRTY